jgi:hypothetical protein
MKWSLAGLGAGMIAVAGTALADPECRPIAPPRDQSYPGTIRLHVDAANINHRVFHIHETLPVVDGEELVLLYPEWLPGTHSPTGRNRINKLAGLTVSAVNTHRLAGAATPVMSSHSALRRHRAPRASR